MNYECSVGLTDESARAIVTEREGPVELIRVGIGRRTLALLVDMVVFSPIAALSFLSYSGSHLLVACGLLLLPSCTLIVMLCIGMWGQTPGMRLLRIKAVTLDGLPLGFRGAILRHSMALTLSLIHATLLFSALNELGPGLFELVTPWFARWQLLRGMTQHAWAPASLVDGLWAFVGIVTLCLSKRTLNDIVSGAIVVHKMNAQPHEVSALEAAYPYRIYAARLAYPYRCVNCGLLLAIPLILTLVADCYPRKLPFKTYSIALNVASRGIKQYHQTHGSYPPMSNDIPVPPEWWTLMGDRVAYFHDSTRYQLTVRLSDRVGLSVSDNPGVMSTNPITINGVTLNPGETVDEIRKKLPEFTE